MPSSCPADCGAVRSAGLQVRAPVGCAIRHRFRCCATGPTRTASGCGRRRRGGAGRTGREAAAPAHANPAGQAGHRRGLLLQGWTLAPGPSPGFSSEQCSVSICRCEEPSLTRSPPRDVRYRTAPRSLPPRWPLRHVNRAARQWFPDLAAEYWGKSHRRSRSAVASTCRACFRCGMSSILPSSPTVPAPPACSKAAITRCA